MTDRVLNILLVLVLTNLPIAADAGWSEAQQATDQTLSAPSQVEQTPTPDVDFNSSPVMFIENAGQWDDGARFQVWGGPAGTLWLANDAIWITVVEPGEVSAQVDSPSDPGRGWFSENHEDPTLRRGVNIRLSFVGANPQPQVETFDRLDTVVSYFYGNDPEQWRPDVPVWGGVRYADLYPGIDLEVTGADVRMMPRLAARPGADLAAVQLRVEGADAVAVDGDYLRLSTAAGKFNFPLLRAEGLQVVGSPIEPSGVQAFDVVAPFVPANANRQSAVKNRKSPTDNPADLLYGTFLGGSGNDYGYGIDVDPAGSAYVTGETSSNNFPTTPGAFDPSYSGGDAFVVKLHPAGSGLIYATFLGGSASDYGYAIAVDGAGNAFVTGSTSSSNFPATPGAFDPSYNNGTDAFVVKLNPAGSALTYGTFLGGSASDYGRAIAVDGAGNAFVTGSTSSSNFPTTPGAFDPNYNNGTDAFVVKLNPAGSTLTYGTFLGGNYDDSGRDIAVDATASVYVTGKTSSSDFPATPGAFDPTYNSGGDAFVVKLNSAGNGLAYATFVGGSGSDMGNGVAIDANGAAYLTGPADSSDFPTTPGAFDTIFSGGGGDGFVVKVSPAGNGLTYATFLGGLDWDEAFDIAVDSDGAGYIVNRTWPGSLPADFPTTPNAFDTSYNGSVDGAVVKLSPDGSSMIYGTFLGGVNGDCNPRCTIAINSSGVAFITGNTASADFPSTPGAFGTSFNGANDAFVAKLAMGGGEQPDFAITAIEVTQAIQDLDNTIPLIAGKRTFARVHAFNQGTASSALVTARLCGPDRCLEPDNPSRRIQVLASPDRARLDQNFHFELPREWLPGSVSLTAEVNPAGPQHVEEYNTANNSLVRSISFGAVPLLKIKFFSVRYRTLPFIWQVHEARAEDFALIGSWLRRAYPVAEVQSSRGVLDYGLSGLGPPTCNAVNEKLWIEWIFDRIEDRIDGHTHYYGIVYDSGGFMRGCAIDISSPVASGPAGIPPGPIGAYWDEDESYGDWYAGHELAHTYGRFHPGYCRGQERDPGHPMGDYPDGRISPADGSMYGFDIENKKVYGPTWHDVMTYCDNQWISGFTYKGIREYLIADGNQAPEETTSVGEHLIVLGTVNHTQNSAELHTLYRVPDVSAPVPPVSGTHHLKLLDINNLVLADYPFTPGKNTSTEPGEDQVGLISEIVPWITGTQRVAVYSDTLELASRPVSTNTPEVTVISPNGSEVFTDTMVVSWSASDADQDPLTYLIQYTPDDGVTWQTVGVDITNTTVYTLDLTLLPGTDQGRVQVIASDGINTGMDASDGTFQVTRKAPQARIYSPVPNSAILFGQTVTLAGEGADVEDGTLAEDALSWSSSLSGALGVGPLVGLTDLITGTHVITLTATDSDGNAGSATVGVVVSFAEDVVPDCQVDILDIQAIANRWQQHVGDTGWDSRFDLDGDGTITTIDIMRVAAVWGTVCQ